MIEKGNIDLTKRPVVKNKDGSISTVRSMSFNDGKHEVLVPTVSDDGRIMGTDEAIRYYQKSGKHLGKFRTPDEATTYAQQLHKEQEQMYAKPKENKRSIEEYLFQKPREEYFSAPVERKVTEEGKLEAKSRTSKMTYDPKSRKSEVESAPIEVDGELPKEEAQAPKTLKEKILPPAEEPSYLPKYEPRAPAPEAPAPRPVQHQPSGPNVWERLLIGATPALVGLISGNKLEGTQIAGDQLANTEADLYKRGHDLDSKLAEYRAKKQMGFTEKNERKPSYAREELYDRKTGKTYVHSIVNGQDAGILGEASPSKVKESYTTRELYNPATKQMEVATIAHGSGAVTFHGKAKGQNNALTNIDFQGEDTKALVDMDNGDVVKYIGKNPEKKNGFADLEKGRSQRFHDQKLLDLTKEFSKPTSNFNKQKENLDGIIMAAEQLNLGNPRANAGLQNYLARNIYGEKGPLSDNDLARLSGDPSYAAVINRFIDARISGKLNELDRNDIRQILDLAYKVQVSKMNGEATRFGSAFKSIGYDPTPGIQAYVNGAIRPIPAHRELGAGHRSHPEDSVMMERDGIQIPVPKERVKEMEKLGAKRITK